MRAIRRVGRSCVSVSTLEVGSSRGVSTSGTSSSSTHTTGASPKPKAVPLKGIRIADDEGIGGFSNFFSPNPTGTIDGFLNTKKRQADAAKASGTLPCDSSRPSTTTTLTDDAAKEEEEARLLEEISRTGKLPSPKRSTDGGGSPSEQFQTGCDSVAPKTIKPETVSGACVSISAQVQPPEPAAIPRSSLPRPLPTSTTAAPSALPKKPLYSRPPNATSASSQSTAKSSTELGNPSIAAPEGGPVYTGAHDAAEYYKDVPRNALSKEEMWTRIQEKTRQEVAEKCTAMDPTEAELVKMEEELREHDKLHYNLGLMAFPDEQRRRDYFSMWQLAMSLNKARWTMLEIHSQRGVKTTGAGLKMLFWKESLYEIAEKQEMAQGQFVDAHPVLRPFAAAVKRAPRITKTYIRGFADARLKVLQQPGNVKQLFDHFDKFYGFYFNTMLEILDCRDDHAEHVMCHVGRAIGLTQHCVMFWKKYAQIGFTMLPADICADNHVNLTLLRNVSLASRDRAVQRVLCEVMSIVKDEMLHAREAAKHCPPKIWPLLMEGMYPNYYLGFLQRHEFNVSAMFADHNIENAGLAWYRYKKWHEWRTYQDPQRLLSEAAPIPYLGISIGHRGSRYQQSGKDGNTPRQACDHKAH